MNKIIAESALNYLEPARAPVRQSACIITAELAGPFFNGGIGTANRALALALRALGYEVDILYTQVSEGRPFSLRGKFIEHVKAFGKFGINLKCINHPGYSHDWQAMSYCALQHLLRHQYDIAFFDDMDGTAYYPLLARRTGCSDLRGTAMCITLHSATQWIMDLSHRPLDVFERYRLIEMERRSIELADAVMAPSAYILARYRSYGWTIPENSIVLPYFSAERSAAQSRKRTRINYVNEIVFFGRLETRKGLWMFCRALDRLKNKLNGRQITFLGKATSEVGEALLKRATAWPFTIRLLTNFNTDQAVAYLKGPGRLAVMPSPEDNSPNTILECIEEGIPFLTCSGSGGEELLDDESRKANLFEPSVDALCARLVEVFESGVVTARPAFNREHLELKFSQWLKRLLNCNAMQLERVSERFGSAQPILVIVIPPDFRAIQAAPELRRTIDAYDRNVRIHVLVAEPAALQNQLKLSGEPSLSVNIANLNDFERIAQSIASGEPTVVALCHINQILSPAWVDRARVCFAVEKSISALTGMITVKKELETCAPPREPYFSGTDKEQEIERYLVGYAPPLFSLGQETNSGFVFMRSEVLAKCSGVRPIDEQYGRLKRLQDWVHEILVTLHCSGERFELAPDLVIERPLSQLEFEVFRLANFMRSLPARLHDYEPGSDQFVLARLAIDRGLERQRSVAHSEYVREIAQRIGTDFKQLPLDTPWDNQARQLAMIASASGQIDLAIDLCAALGTQETARPLKLAEYLQSAVAGEVVNVIRELATGNFSILCPNQEKIPDNHADTRLITMNTILGRVQGLFLPTLNLTNITHFTSMITVPEPTDDPVRFRIELISRNRRRIWSAKRIWSAEKVLRGGEESVWEVECPPDFRTTCAVRLSVELANFQDTKCGMVEWVNPQFARRPRGNIS